MTSKDFFEAVEQMANQPENSLSVDQILDSFAKGLRNGYKKLYGNDSCYVEFKPEKQEIIMKGVRVVVEDVLDFDMDLLDKKTFEKVSSFMEEKNMSNIAPISLEDAKEYNKRAAIGSIVEFKVDIKDVFSRSAVSQTKQVMNQNFRDQEKKNTFQYFKNMEGEMILANVIDQNENYLVLSIGQGATTLLPRKELLPTDRFDVGDKIKVYVTKVEDGGKTPKVFVSRNDKNFVKRILENHIPEIKDQSVEIKGIARDCGDRCKVAVWSKDPDIDPIGACVGEGGNRIRNVISDLGGEKIDLYEWSEDARTLIANSLQPTDVIAVINVDEKSKTSLAIVPDGQLSLAIGKNGQNVRLAVQSCGWKIDIKPESLAREQGYEWD